MRKKKKKKIKTKINNMSEKIYIIGHKSPDLDSVIGAISYANFKNKLENTDIYKPAIAGNLNIETEHVLKEAGLSTPEILNDLSDKKIIMVDHNEFSQAVNGIEKAEIIEVIDHHKIEFKYSQPITFKTLPLGASCSIIFNEYKSSGVSIDKNLAKAMLAAILVDTVITKSPTCTKEDIVAIKELAELSNIKDWQSYGIELFKIRSMVEKLSAKEIVKSDFKDFNLNQVKIGIGQVESVDLSNFKNRKQEIVEAIESLKEKENYHTIILFITDIINEGSWFLVVSDDQEKINQAFNVEFVDNACYIKGIISRKKQVVPKVREIFN